MANGVFNVAKGRVNELVRRVDANDPSTSGLVVVALKATGLEADGTLEDYDTLAAILAAANDEATNTNYARKVLTDTDVSAPAVDDTANRQEADIPDLVWSPGPTTGGGAWGKLVVCYAPDTGGADSTLIPLTHQDFAVTPDGTVITATVDAAGFFRAS